MDAAAPCKKGTNNARLKKLKREVVNPTRFQNKACMYRGSAWVHETTSGIISTERSWRSHRKQKGIFDDPSQFGAQVYSHASSDENSRCEESSGQGLEEAWDDSNLTVGESLKQEGNYSGSTKRQKESPLCYIDGHLSSQKCGVRTTNFRSGKDELWSEVTM